MIEEGAACLEAEVNLLFSSVSIPVLPFLPSDIWDGEHQHVLLEPSDVTSLSATVFCWR